MNYVTASPHLQSIFAKRGRPPSMVTVAPKSLLERFRFFLSW
ncbi:MAG: hypothetical protein QXL98_02575 [Thermofilaceae archaeon]